MTLPLAVHYRLGVLVEAAEAVQATRSEIIGMLIATAESDPVALEHSIMTYRKMSVADVVQGQPVSDSELDDNVVFIERRGPGRPARSSRADART
jgi:hypothetical protein